MPLALAAEFPAAHLLQSGEVPTSFKVAGCPLPVKWRAAYLPQSSDLPGGESGGRALCLRGSRPVMGPGATPAAMARAIAAGEHPSDAEATARKGRLNHTGTFSEGKTFDVTVSEGKTLDVVVSKGDTNEDFQFPIRVHKEKTLANFRQDFLVENDHVGQNNHLIQNTVLSILLHSRSSTNE